MATYSVFSVITLLFCSKLFHRKLLAPLGVFAACWLLVLATHFTDILGYYTLSPDTLICVQVLFVGFLGGCLSGSVIKLRPDRTKPSRIFNLYKAYAVWARVLLIIGIIFGLGIYVGINGIIIAKVGVQTESATRFGEALPGPIRNLMYLWGFPCLTTASLISASLHARLRELLRTTSGPQQKEVKDLQRSFLRILVLSTVAHVIADFTSASRGHSVQVIMILFSSYVVINKSRWNLKSIVYLFLVFIAFSSMLGAVTAARGADLGGSILTGLLVYYTGALGYFNAWLTTSRFDTYYWGHESLVKIVEYIAWPLWVPRASQDILWAQSTTSLTRQEFLYVAPGIRFNAFGTFMMDPYFDCGVIGIAIMAFLLGCISTYLFRIAKARTSPLSVVMGVFSICLILWSPIGWADATINNWVTLPAFVILVDVLANYQVKKYKTM